MEKRSKIFVAGHRGLVGSAIIRRLKHQGYENIITRKSAELDLRNQSAVHNFFEQEKPEYVFLAAAKVGGILANSTRPAEFIYDNLAIQNNVIHEAFVNNVDKMVFLGSSCIYPKNAPQPIKEEYLLGGDLEPTNEAYAVAKIAGIKLCQSYYQQYGKKFISVMPTNLYGPGDNYNLNNSHVLPALIRKFHEAKINNDKTVIIWGTGKPRREFLHSDDMASACLFLMENYEGKDIINIGVGEDISILELALLIKSIVGYNGEIITDTSKPDGTIRKLLDVGKIIALGWKPEITLEAGIKNTYENFKTNYEVYTGINTITKSV